MKLLSGWVHSVMWPAWPLLRIWAFHKYVDQCDRCLYCVICDRLKSKVSAVRVGWSTSIHNVKLNMKAASYLEMTRYEPHTIELHLIKASASCGCLALWLFHLGRFTRVLDCVPWPLAGNNYSTWLPPYLWSIIQQHMNNSRFQCFLLFIMINRLKFAAHSWFALPDPNTVKISNSATMVLFNNTVVVPPFLNWYISNFIRIYSYYCHCSKREGLLSLFLDPVTLETTSLNKMTMHFMTDHCTTLALYNNITSWRNMVHPTQIIMVRLNFLYFHWKCMTFLL